MATQGIVSIVNEQGETLVKAICGCDGYNAEKLATWLKENPTLDLFEIHRKALELDFGCTDDLVVMSAKETYFLGDDDLPDLYRQTFSDPRCNPRWNIGTAPYVEVVVMAGVPTMRAPDRGGPQLT